MKRFLLVLLSLLIIATPLTASDFKLTPTPYKVFVDGKQMDKPTLTDGQNTYVSLREAAELFGADIEWDGNVSLITHKEKTVAEVVEENIDNCVLINAVTTNAIMQASGVIYNGYIITNKHVTSFGNIFTVEFNQNKLNGYTDILDGTKYKENKNLDIGLLKPKENRNSTIRLGDSDKLKIGDKIIAISSPKAHKNTISEGLVSGFRNDEGYNEIQTTAKTLPGSSGGGLFNMDGELVGIIYSGQNDELLNFAIPVNDFKDFLE